MRYRILAPALINNPFRVVSFHYVDEKSGEERDLPFKGPEEVFSMQVETGMVVELDDKTKPGPWMEPLDDEARAQCALYPDAYAPSEIATVDSLAMRGESLPDRQSYANEVAGPSKAPIYPKGTNERLMGRPAPKLPSLGGAARRP